MPDCCWSKQGSYEEISLTVKLLNTTPQEPDGVHDALVDILGDHVSDHNIIWHNAIHKYAPTDAKACGTEIMEPTKLSCFHSLGRRLRLQIGRRLPGCLLVFVVLLTPFACRQQSSDVNTESFLVPTVTSIETPREILFIGNSYTYYNGGINSHLQRLAASASPPNSLVVESQTTPNQTLKGHYNDNVTQRALARRLWDVVILQGASYEPVDHSARPEFFEFAQRLDEEIKEIGAQTVFFMTWGWQFSPGMIVDLRNAYLKQGNKIGALVVPVGIAWEQVRQERPGLSLHSDPRHSNLKGTYLAACVFYAALLGQSPVGLSYTAGIENGEARYLQQVAWETTRSFYHH